MNFSESINEFVNKRQEKLLSLIRELCKIPAPSHGEEKRAEYVYDFFKSLKVGKTYIDSAKNACLLIKGKCDKITVISAHTDTVFPDTEPMPYYEDENVIRCPGVGDDTTSLAMLMLCAEYIAEKKITPEASLLIAANSCEEGLGNLKGMRKIFDDYGKDIIRLVTFDANLGVINEKCVGSQRYEVTVRTEGGHSFGAFGKKNAIAELSEIISRIYSLKLPEKEGCKTTYNVGSVEGGTSVNTIAQSAKMLCEYRSDDEECLDIMREKFSAIFRESESEDVKIEVKNIGNRPCATKVDTRLIKELSDMAILSYRESGYKGEIRFPSSSTDANIPLSLSIPAICMGVYIGRGSHTREEEIDKSSLLVGLRTALSMMLRLCK